MLKSMGVGAVALLTLVAAADESTVQITFGDCRDCNPAVSPDGKHMAFASDRTGPFNIYLLTFGESGVRQLTQSKKDDCRPSWSHNGKHIIFDSRRTGSGDLYEMANDGAAGFLQMTDRADRDEWPNYDITDTGLVFATASVKGFSKVNPKMDVVYAQVKGQANTARVLADGDEPKVSPDGKRVLFVSNRTKNKDLWIMGLDGGLQTQLTTDPKDDTNPAFSPKGDQVVFASNRAGSFDLWVMNVDGSDVRQLTSTPENETEPCWSVGGYIYYTRDAGERKSSIYRIKAP
ncbi:MAG TPA: hypothetical protein PLO37_05920 [Candidatus Hydrogenedentes bacterium]|nr:hypothetical protein [Candidatus Hydrogenedentota bacterium]